MKKTIGFSWISVVLLCTVCRASDGEATASLRKWEALSEHATFDEIRTYSEAVRGNAAAGDREILDGLIRIARDETQSETSRCYALWVASELCDQSAAKQLVEFMNELLTQLEGRVADKSFEERKTIVKGYRSLIQWFLKYCSENVLSIMEDHSAVLAFLRNARLSRLRHFVGWREDCERLIVQCNVSPDARRAVVLEIIEKEDGRVLSDTLVQVVDNGLLPRLRQIVRAAANGRDFNYAAASALAHLGDAEIVADLEKFRSMIEAAGPTAKSFLNKWLHQIDVQNPPAKLLEYIAGTDADPKAIRQRAWAVRRASQLGIDPGDIRDAILQHGGKAQSRYERSELKIIKIQALKLGILQPGDLAEVEIEERHRKR